MHIHYIVFPDSHPEEPITRGFEAWTAVSNFTFERVREESFAKIRVYFQVRDKELHHPLMGLEESWLTPTIATHEVGHLLGLGHSRVLKANMYAYTGTAETKPLIQDDIDGIRAKYST
ncbi:metalloendoproteinase 1-like [Vitis riparia]|uniref:metalloendoproteinase 1-like n=1 Tax=Vitis riparia TaxID=96939 RepID=UPI00155B1501|nr:metalloendoproteinase 1-like [Vitis riparia]